MLPNAEQPRARPLLTRHPVPKARRLPRLVLGSGFQARLKGQQATAELSAQSRLNFLRKKSLWLETKSVYRRFQVFRNVTESPLRKKDRMISFAFRKRGRGDKTTEIPRQEK